jgi:hypothetical protein
LGGGVWKAVLADFGPPLKVPTEAFELVKAIPFDACACLTNTEDLRGKAVLVERGTCLFMDKVGTLNP